MHSPPPAAASSEQALGRAWEGMIMFGAHLCWLPVLLVLLYLGPSPTQDGTSRGKG